jgi:hypothetical protein
MYYILTISKNILTLKKRQMLFELGPHSATFDVQQNGFDEVTENAEQTFVKKTNYS